MFSPSERVPGDHELKRFVRLQFVLELRFVEGRVLLVYDVVNDFGAQGVGVHAGPVQEVTHPRGAPRLSGGTFDYPNLTFNNYYG